MPSVRWETCIDEATTTAVAALPDGHDSEENGLPNTPVITHATEYTERTGKMVKLYYERKNNRIINDSIIELFTWTIGWLPVNATLTSISKNWLLMSTSGPTGKHTYWFWIG